MVARALAGVSGAGQVGSFAKQVSVTLAGVAANGQTGSFAVAGGPQMQGVAGQGQAGHLITPWVQAFIAGVAGAGQAGSIGVGQTVTLSGVAATGLAGSFTLWVRAYFHGVAATGFVGDFTGGPGGHLSGVAGIGQVGKITVGVSGGGTSKRLDDSADAPRRRRKMRANPGFDAIAKQPDRKVGAKRKPLLPPPDLSGHGVVVPAVAPPVADLVAGDAALALAQAIATAQDLSDINRLLAGFDADDQDVADILDVLALID